MMVDFILTFTYSITISGVVLLAFFLYKFRQLTKPLPAPEIDENEYWGPDKAAAAPKENDKSIRPFRIDFGGQKAIDNLQRQLAEPLCLHPPLRGISGDEHGVNSREFQSILEYWRTDYLARWQEREALFNSVPHFKTTIQG